MIKIVPKKVKLEFGLRDIRNTFAIRFLKRKDIYKCGDWVVSATKTAEGRHYFIWNIRLRNEMAGALLDCNYEIARQLLKDHVHSREFARQIDTLINKHEKTKQPHLKRERENALLGLFSIAGYVDLGPVKHGWRAQHVEFAFLRKDLRGKGLGKMLYDAMLVAGGEILAAGETQSCDSRRLWLSIIRNKDYTCWVDNDLGQARIVEHLDPEELSQLTETELKDENKRIHAPYKVWYVDRASQDPHNVTLYAIAKRPSNRFVIKKQTRT